MMKAHPHSRQIRANDARKACGSIAIAVVTLLSLPVVAAEHAKIDKEQHAADALPLPPVTPLQLTPAEQYCASVVDAAAAAQIAQQTVNLERARKQLTERIALLDAKTAELKNWIKRREEFAAHATDMVVEIYSKMTPDAAARQVTSMDELTAAALMSKLPPKVSSRVLAEMDAVKAARLTATIAGAAEMAAKLEALVNAQHR